MFDVCSAMFKRAQQFYQMLPKTEENYQHSKLGLIMAATALLELCWSLEEVSWKNKK